MSYKKSQLTYFKMYSILDYIFPLLFELLTHKLEYFIHY
jgi:hypothetical protein